MVEFISRLTEMMFDGASAPVFMGVTWFLWVMTVLAAIKATLDAVEVHRTLRKILAAEEPMARKVGLSEEERYHELVVGQKTWKQLSSR